MFDTEERTTARPESPSRRLAEVRELEELWAISEGTAPAAPRPRARQLLARYRVGVLFTIAWLGFLTVLFGFAPASDPGATPGWVTNTAGVMLTALLFAPMALLSRTLGYGASAVAGGCGVALAVSCFTVGHTGFWPSYQLGGFALLAVGGAVVAARSARR